MEMKILERLCVINRDDGCRFTRTDRLDAIAALLWDSPYRRINCDGLFHLYGKKPPAPDRENAVFVSAHVDCERSLTRFFTREEADGMLRGAYDNAITNAAIVAAMLTCDLPDNVYVCFTGDEEYGSAGANAVLEYLVDREIIPRAIVVLDVTGEGWDERADFTVENDFFNKDVGRRVVRFAEKSGMLWRFVPADPDKVPYYVDAGNVIWQEAAEDESWDYDEGDQNCFSFCLPVSGDMHNNKGVLARKASYRNYVSALAGLLRRLALDEEDE